MSRAENKASRLLQIEAMLLSHPEGLAQSEIARRLGVNRSTVGRYLPDLPKHIYIDDDGRWRLDREAYLVQVRFSLHEALAVHLASRLLATRMDRQNPHAAAALRKLGTALERLAPRISQHLGQSADIMDDVNLQRQDPVYLQVLEKLTLAWAEQRKTRIWHRLEATDQVYQYTFSPYFIEPYAVGQTTHVIGWREPPDALRTFKIERVERIELLRDHYEIPADFDPRSLLADAWGIWYTESEPVEVKLRFHPRVAKRVSETRWHRSQIIETQPDSSLLWRANVAEPHEMMSWIRGWGADVEVLEPEGLREAMVREAKRMVRMYNLTTNLKPALTKLLRLWGKTPYRSQLPDEFHPAIFHMLDVGHVAQELLSDKASPRWQIALGRVLGANPTTLADWLPWLVAVHDIGKISAAFQQANEAQYRRLQAEGFSFGDRQWNNTPYHALISAIYLDEGMNWPNLPDILRLAWRDVYGGHHGEFSGKEARKATHYLLQAEPPEWMQLRLAATELLKTTLLHEAQIAWPQSFNLSSAIMALTGFTVLCDWIGSDENYFRPAPEDSWDEYCVESASRAKKAVAEAGLFQSTVSFASTGFAALFSDLKQTRPLQAAIDSIPDDILSAPCLTIIEAPTGEGKTEAALALAHRLAVANGADELYYALPTTATSNQMYGRLQKHINQRLGLTNHVRLVHGQAFLLEDEFMLAPLQNGKEHSAAPDWFGSDKRKSLLLPFGVGTIDQAELAALNVRFTALRLIGLAGKVVILDEVHAYDTYMTTIVERLLNWLTVLGTSVILLSATLPASRRKALERAYGAKTVENEENQMAYPKLCVIGQTDNYFSNPTAMQPNRRLIVSHLAFGDDAVAEKACWLLKAIANGGCVCWITNTVGRAQKIFEHVDRLAAQDVDRMLLHARFPLDDRQTLEGELTAKYGPEGKRPAKGVVIGTQVLEQSLDLDFDLMVTDVAPIDLLLQRAGRLHRHAHHVRPPAHDKPRLWINTPQSEDESISLITDAYIYDEFILRQTWQALRGRAEICLPADYRLLVEAVYNDSEPAHDSPLWPTWEKLQKKQEKARGEAYLRILPEPDYETSFCGQLSRLTFEESESKAGWIVAQTRLGEESLTIIPLERDGNIARLWPTNETVALDAEASRTIQKNLLRRSIRTSHYQLIRALKNEKPSHFFTESALLKECYPLWLQNGTRRIELQKGSLLITLHPQLGLVIEKEKEVNE